VTPASASWGLRVYEQDWLNVELVSNARALRTDVSLGSRWLRQMAEAAGRAGLTIQYCMPLVRHLVAVRAPVLALSTCSSYIYVLRG
jgi:hypothetical protein